MLASVLGAASLALLSLSPARAAAAAYPPMEGQQVFFPPSSEPQQQDQLRHSGLSKWSYNTKMDFIKALENDNAQDWTIVMGNEAGDLDSLVSALAYSWHLSHLNHPKKAVALLQTEEDALDLRPENALALSDAGMKHKHDDLLALDDLPYHRAQVAAKIEALALVDHNTILSNWKADDKVHTVIDHHADRGTFPDAHPRIIEMTGSCSTLVAREMLNHQHEVEDWPHELVDLLLSAIAIDTDGPAKGTMDYDIAKELFTHSSWADDKFKKSMKKLDKKLKKAKKDLGHLDVRDLLRRDWKGDVVRSSDSTEENPGRGVHLGFASCPTVGLLDMVERTESKTIDEFFEIESAFTQEIKADISVALTKYKDEDKNKHRQIILVVKAIHRLNEEEARSLFNAIVKHVEASEELGVTEWKGDLGELGHKRKVWWNNNEDAGRKVVRPVIEAAVKQWLDDNHF